VSRRLVAPGPFVVGHSSDRQVLVGFDSPSHPPRMAHEATDRVYFLNAWMSFAVPMRMPTLPTQLRVSCANPRSRTTHKTLVDRGQKGELCGA